MIKVITPPTAEPVTVAEVKAHAVISHSSDDALLGMMISAARAHAEGITGRRLAATTLECVLVAFPDEIVLTGAPITAITSVKYLDEDGVEQTMDTTDYATSMDGLVGRIVPVNEWPETSITALEAVRVRYVAGFTPSTIPQDVKMWMLVRVATLYAQRETMVVGGNITELGRNFVDGLLDQWIVPGGM